MEILKGDESQATANTLLPSGFFTLSLEKKNGRANRLQIEGGGYGHGVGMSQNGANRMAQQGMGYEEILKFFYEGIDIQKI